VNKIFNINDIIKVPRLDMVGKIIDSDVTEEGNNTIYLVVFDNGTFDSFLGIELEEN
jgi:hypothetical protein